MKVSEAQKKLDQAVESAVNNWINGNLSDTVKVFKTLNPMSAAYVAILASERLGERKSGMLARRLQSEGLDSMTRDNW